MGEAPAMSGVELATGAGVDEAFVERLADLGILTPDDGRYPHADLFRVKLVAACDRAGIAPEAIAQALDDGKVSLSFLEQPQFGWATIGTETYGELADRLGLPGDIVVELAAAAGAGRPTLEDRTRQDDEVIFELVAKLSGAVDADAIARVSRVYMDGLRRMASAESSLWETQVIGGWMRAGMT